MEIGEEAMPFYDSSFFDFLVQDEETQKYKEEKHVMGMCYNNGRNSNVSIASIDPANNRRPRYPLSANAFLGLDPTAIRCPRHPSAAADAFLSAAATELLHNRRRRMRSLSSSRGSSPSPLSPIENFETPPSRSPTAFKATPPPTKVVGEEVLVMDGILVDAPCGVNRAVARPSSDSPGTPGSLYKTEICRPWVDTGTCRYGLRCQFAHGKEELRPARPPKFKPEICKSFAVTGTCAFGPKCRYTHSVIAAKPAIKMTEMEMETIAAAAPPPPTRALTEAEEMITAALGGDAEAYINQVLYGHALRRRRLPVFVQMCPE